jgi:hypothetical protein
MVRRPGMSFVLLLHQVGDVLDYARRDARRRNSTTIVYF